MEAFAQTLPTGVNRVDGDLSSTKSGDGSGSVNVDIGTMDTGIQLSHPDLNVYRQVSFVSATSSGNDVNGHGTAVAGVVAAKDSSAEYIIPSTVARYVRVTINGNIQNNACIYL